MPRTTWHNATALVAFQLRFANLLRQSLQILLSSKACPTLNQTGRKPHPTMYSDIDESEWAWEKILTRRIHPDDQPTQDEEDETPTDDE